MLEVVVLRKCKITCCKWTNIRLNPSQAVRLRAKVKVWWLVLLLVLSGAWEYLYYLMSEVVKEEELSQGEALREGIWGE